MRVISLFKPKSLAASQLGLNRVCARTSVAGRFRIWSFSFAAPAWNLSRDGLMLRAITALPSWVDSQIWLDANRDIVWRSDSQNPLYGEIPPAKPEQLLTDRASFSAEDALLSFGILTASQKRPDALAALCAGASEIQLGYPGEKILEVMASGQSREKHLPPYVAVEIHRVAHQAILTPDELFVACVRFVQWAKKSNLQRVLTPPLEAWARAAWAHAIEEQWFNLRSPASSVLPIHEVLISPHSGLNFLGKLVVSAQPAVHHKFDQSFRDFLLSL
jgi:hypothetical protein